MKIKSLATMLTMGLLISSFAYVAPALAADENTNTSQIASDPADEDNNNLQTQNNDTNNPSPNLSQNNQNNPNTPENLAGNNFSMDQATPDTATGDDDY